MQCTWCGEPATWILVADADLHSHDHSACDEHRTRWGHLYRRSVAVARDLVIDVRDDGGSDTVDVSTSDQHVVDLEG